MVFDALTLDVDTAVGVAVHPDHGSDAATLLQRVDLAATAAKSVPGSVQLFNPALESRSLRRLGLAGDLRRALDDGELEVYFQPKVDAAGPPAGRGGVPGPLGAPGARRRSPRRTSSRWPSTPASSAGSPRWCSARGCAAAGTGAHAEQPLAVAVNLSARTLIDPHFPDRVRGAARPSTASRRSC